MEYGVDVVGAVFPVCAHPVFFGGAVDCGEVELVLGGAEGEHEVEYGFVYFLGSAVGFIDFVYYDDGFEAYFYCFFEDETCLWHWAFEGVDE